MTRPATRLSTVGNEAHRARVELAAAYRIVAKQGLDDGIWTHFSLQVPGTTDRFLLKPHGLLFEEVSASNLIMVDLDGNLIEGSGNWEPTAFYIHSRIHAALPQAKCILHGHTPYAMALGNVVDDRLPMMGQTAVRFRNRVAYYSDYVGLAMDAATGDRICAAMQGKDILVMAHHGINVVGATVADALYSMRYFELACRDLAHARMMAAGTGIKELSDEMAEATFKQLEEERRDYAQTHLDAYMRKLDRECPEYRN